MTEPLILDAEVRARIQALPYTELQAFFDEVPVAGMRRVARMLPPVHGFRTTSPEGIARQLEALARRLAHPNPIEHDYQAFYIVWREWTDAKLPTTASERIEEMEEAVGKADRSEGKTVLEQQAISLAEKLRQESQQNLCTREQIERAFKFGPFPEISAVRDIIARAKAAVEVDRDTTLNDLPERLREDENQIKSMGGQINAIESRIKLLEEIRTAVPRLSLSLDTVNAALEDIRKIAAKQSRAAATEVADVFKGQLGAVQDRLDKLQSDLRDTQIKVPDLRSFNEVLAQTTTAAKQVVAQYSDQVIRITSELGEVRRQLGEFLNEWARAEPGKQNDRLLRLEQRAASVPPDASGPSIVPHAYVTGLRSTESRLHVERLQHVDSSQTHAIRSPSDLAAALARPLESIGLRKSSARIFAEECAAAVVDRQVIFLQGGLATQVARALALALAGPASARLPIPVGLLDGEELRFSLEQAAETGKAAPCAVAIEGINRAALDIMQQTLVDCSDRDGRASSKTFGRAIIFATVLRGAASLPVDATYSELGPIFDLDYLDWRTGTAVNPTAATNSLSAECDDAMHTKAKASLADIDECLQLIRHVGGKRNTSIERTAVSAYRALQLTRSDHKTITPLQSLCYGWVLPYWRALGLARDIVEDKVDGGRLGGSAADPRLAAMLEHEFSVMSDE